MIYLFSYNHAVFAERINTTYQITAPNKTTNTTTYQHSNSKKPHYNSEDDEDYDVYVVKRNNINQKSNTKRLSFSQMAKIVKKKAFLKRSAQHNTFNSNNLGYKPQS